MSRGSDQVFQLSLTEIAFTIAFMLLLLLGYMIFMQRDKVEQADQFLQDSRGIEQQQEALERVKEELTTAMRDAGATNADEMLSRLVDTESLRQERDRLLQKFEDLEEQISALTELKQQLEDATSSNVTKTTLDQAIAALALQAGIAQSAIDDIGAGRPPAALPGAEQAIARFIAELFGAEFVGDAAFAELRRHYTPRQITDIAMSATYYRALGTMVMAFRVDIEAPEVLQVEREWQKGRV